MAEYANITTLLTKTTADENKKFSHVASIPCDPIFMVIKKYRAGLDEYNALPSEMTEDPQANEYTWMPWWNILKGWDRAALTEQGAIAAVNLAKDELKDNSYSPIVEPLLKAACLYFNKTH